MQAEKNDKPKTVKKSKKKLLLSILAILIVLILLVLVLIPGVISSEKGQKIIRDKINESVDGDLNFADLSMGWIRGVKLTDISFRDSAGQTSATIKQITTKPHYASILTGHLSFGKTIIDNPQIQTTLAPAEKTKPQPPDARQPSNDKKAPAPVLPVEKIDMVINNGNLKVTDQYAKSIELSSINSKVNLRPPGSKTSFDINMTVVDKEKTSNINMVGQIKPSKKTGWTLKGTTGQVAVEIDDLELSSLQPIFDLTGTELQARGQLSANFENQIKDGQIEALTGTISGKDLDITGPQLKGDRLTTQILDIDVKLKTEKDIINIDKLNVQTDWARANITGVVPTDIAALADLLKPDSKYNLKADFNCDLAAISSQMPRTIGIKETTSIRSGQLTGNLETKTQNGKRAVTGQASIADLAGTVEGKQVALSEPIRATAKITADKKIINFDELKISAAFCQIECTGTSKELNYNANVNLTKLQSELGQFVDIGQNKIAGQIEGTGKISREKNETTVTGSSTITALQITSPQQITASEPQAKLTFAITAQKDKKIVKIDTLQADTSFGQITTKNATLPMDKDTEEPTSLDLSANVDLAKLRPFAIVLAGFPADMQLAGLAESQLHISSKKDIYWIKTDSTKIKGLKIGSAGAEPFEQQDVSIVFDIEADNAAKTINIKKLQLITPQIKIRKGELKQSTSGDKTKLQGRLDCEYDWAALSAAAAPFLPKGLKLTGQRTDSIDFSTEYPKGQSDKLIANLNTKAKLGFDSAKYMGLNVGRTEVDIQIRKGLLTIAPFSSTVNNGRLNFAANANFDQKPTLLKTPGTLQIVENIQINDETSKELLMYVNPIFANALNVSGIANFNCEKLAIPLAEANKNDMEVVGTLSMTDVKLQASNLLGQILSTIGSDPGGQNITVHPTRFIVKDGQLSYDDMQIDVGQHPINFKGVIGLNKSLNMTVILPYTTQGKPAVAGEDTLASRVSVPLGGTLDNPQLDLGKMLEQQLKQRFEQELRKRLEGIF